MVVLWSAEHICSVVLDPKIRRFYMVDVQFVCLFVYSTVCSAKFINFGGEASEGSPSYNIIINNYKFNLFSRKGFLAFRA